MKHSTIGVAVLVVLAAVGQVQASIWGLESQAVGISGPPTHLFRFEPDGSSFTDVGAVRLSGNDIDADALALSPTYGLRALELTAGGSTLLSINSSTAVASTIGSGLAGREIRGATFDLSDRLWVLDATNDQLLEINPTTGVIMGSTVNLTLAGNPVNLSTVTDIAVRSDGTFYVSNLTAAGIDFYTLDVSNGKLTSVGSDTASPQQAVAGIAFSMGAPSQSMFAYDINGADDLFEYDVDSSFARTTLYPNIISSFNAGRGDLAAIVIPEPGSLIVWSLLGLAGISVGCWRRRRQGR